MKKQKKQDRLSLFYKKSGIRIYGMFVVCASRLYKQLFTDPFTISKNFGDREIVYGSLTHLMAKIIDIIYTSMNIGPDPASIPEEMKSSVHLGRHIKTVIYNLPKSDHSESILHQQGQVQEEKVILVSVHLRNLLDVFNKGNKDKINIYDYEDKEIDEISLREFIDLVIHHRYIFVDGIHICDIVSDKKQLPSERLFGSKVNILDFFNAALNIVNGIKIKDFVGVLRSRLIKLSASSEPRDILFAAQNVYALNNMIKDRIADKRFGPIAKLLFSAKSKNVIKAAMQRDLPHFKIAGDLSKKVFETHLSINGKPEVVEIAYEALFDAIIQAYGNEALVTTKALGTEIRQAKKPKQESP